MKAPCLYIALAFASGTTFYSSQPRADSVTFLRLAAPLLLAALLTFRFVKTTWPAAALSLALFASLGAAAAHLEREAIPPNNVARLADRGQLPTTQPLRWRGVLREDPAPLPQGIRYEIALSDVEISGTQNPIRGGLRLTYYFKPHVHEDPPAIHAGDSVEALARAHAPRNFMDPGAFDLRSALARQGIDLIGTLRSTDLLTKLPPLPNAPHALAPPIDPAPAQRSAHLPSPAISSDSASPQTPASAQTLPSPHAPALPLAAAFRLARLRGTLLTRVDSLFPASPDSRAILRAMLLGDRSFVDSDTALDFQRTGAFHVLVVAGLHVGALCVFLLWLGRTLRAPLWLTIILTGATLIAYAAIVQDHPPVLRATLTALIYLAARLCFRRVDPLNTVALAAFAILLFRPSESRDPSFQLSFLAAGSIAGLALPLIARFIEPLRAAFRHLGDITRDLSHAPRLAELRLDLRATARVLSQRLPRWTAYHTPQFIARSANATLRLAELLLLSLVLQFATLPLLVLQFHRVALSSTLSNIPAVILTSLIVPLGFLALATSFLSTHLAALPAAALNVLLRALTITIHWFAAFARLSYRLPGPPPWLLAASLLALAVLAAVVRSALDRAAFARTSASRRFTHRRVTHAPSNPRFRRTLEIAAPLAFIAATLLIATHPFAPSLHPRRLEITVLDVGQGDSIFVAFPDATTMLIDGGGEPGSQFANGHVSANNVGEEVVAPYLWARGLKKIDVMVLTHAHHDHLDGLHAILDDFQVNELWVGLDVQAQAYKDLIEHAGRAGTRVIHRRDPEAYSFAQVRGTVLWPVDEHTVPQPTNNDSLVMRLTDGKFSFMLPGDAEQKVEKNLSEAGHLINADFLKVPHHGSKTSSTDEFLNAVSPRVAVISVGEGNSFGHPAPIVVERYRQRGIRLLRTDQDGAVIALTDGNSLQISTYREEHPAN